MRSNSAFDIIQINGNLWRLSNKQFESVYGNTQKYTT